ncbi:MAG: putative acyl-CoA dehydrogenase [Frankiales bacterium]|nr:putative acyl-CoA dehydrogenase [Frankiales bacterium]
MTAPTDATAPTGAWELPEELVLLRETVRRFVQTEVRPLEDRLPHDAAGFPAAELAGLQKKARDLGLWALATPEEFGGAGLSVLGQVVVAEAAAACRMGAYFPAGGAFGGNPPSVLFRATPEQWDRFGRPIVEGRAGKAFTAITEATGGSDPARAIRCRAERDGDEYVLNGAKMWISHAGTADWGVVYARTGGADERGGISCLVVERDTPGLTMTPIGVMNSFSPYELHFDDARVPIDNRIGAEGEGFGLASEFLVHGRIVYAAGPIGIAQHALGLAIEWAKERQVFGGPLADKQAVQFVLADSEIELRAARLLMYQAAWNADLGKDVQVDASVSKVYGTETAFRVLDRVMQVFGAMGLSKEMPIERWFRDLRVKLLGEGASEVQRMIIARRLLR